MFGELVQSRDRAGRITKYAYDTLGRQTKNTLCDTQGNPLLDGNNQPIFTQSVYDDAGQVTARRDERGYWTRSEYDAGGRQTKTWDATHNDTSGTPTSETHYDSEGRQDWTKDAAGRVTNYEYDDAGRLTKTLLPLLEGQTESTRSFSETVYNDQGQVTKQIVPGGMWKSMTYDILGRLQTVTVPVDDDPTHNQTSTTSYDDAGQKDAQTDARSRRTTFAYDSLGRLTSRTLPNGKSESTTYNVLGQVESKTDFKGKTTTFKYDLRGRLLSKTPDASLNEAPITFVYSPDELTRTVTRGNQVTTYKTDLDRGWLNEVVNSGTVNGTVSYTYDVGGNKLSTTSTTVKNGVTQSNATAYRYDPLSRVDRATFGDNTTTVYTYDAVGNRATVTRSNGTSTLYTYDNQNRLTNQQNARGAGTASAQVLSVFDYTVRSDGKRTQLREQVLNPASSNVNFTTRTISYDFDKAGRLSRETREERQTLRAGGEQSSTRISGYEYDEVSNRKKLTTNTYNGLGASAQLVSTSTVDYTYNAADELTDETTTSGAGSSTKTYGYDDNGAQTSVTSNGIATPYRYDFEGKLVSVGDGTSSTRSSYLYDGDGNRLSSVVVNGTNVKTTQFLNDTNTAYVQVLEERDENGTLRARYDYGDGDLQKLTRRKDSDGSYQSRWFLNDGLDSTRQLVDENGVVTDSYAYDAFGNTSDRSGATENTRLYNGQQQDETGLYFLRARYMNTSTGRFLNHDPLLGSSGDPASMHRYTYASNDPINGTDPSGRETLINVMSAVAIGTAFIALPGCNQNSGSSFYDEKQLSDLTSDQLAKIQLIRDKITQADDIKVPGCKNLAVVCNALFDYKLKMASDTSPFMKSRKPGYNVLAFSSKTPQGENYMAFSKAFFDFDDSGDLSGDEKRARIIVHECLHHFTDLQNPGADDNPIHQRLYGWSKFLSSQLFSENDKSYIPSNLKDCIVNNATPEPDASTQSFTSNQWAPYYGESFLPGGFSND